jgi:hypothetical protein
MPALGSTHCLQYWKEGGKVLLSRSNRKAGVPCTAQYLGRTTRDCGGTRRGQVTAKSRGEKKREDAELAQNNKDKCPPGKEEEEEGEEREGWEGRREKGHVYVLNKNTEQGLMEWFKW